MHYLPEMLKNDLKKVLWVNVQTRMNSVYGKENLTRLIRDARVGPGTITRIKDQETSVGLDVLEKLSAALRVDPWQLLHPTLGVSLLKDRSDKAKKMLDHAAMARDAADTKSAFIQAIEARFMVLPDDIEVMAAVFTDCCTAMHAAEQRLATQRTALPDLPEIKETSS